MDGPEQGVLLVDRVRAFEGGRHSADDEIVSFMIDYGQLRMILYEIKRTSREGDRKCVIEQYVEATRLAAARIPKRFHERLAALRELEEFYPALLQ